MVAPSRLVAACLASGHAIRLAPGHDIRSPVHLMRRSPVVPTMAEPDPLANPLLGFINSLQETIQTSPAAKFKAGLAKLQAGDYDVATVQSELNTRIRSTPCLMYSFTT
mmetsp:Transcript_22544/g.72900  ORF Transcript_22544/g.72900 Transcript_22544/m.72900 type:complete len:109 (+) Transcript_22544:14-340(+)